MKSANALVLVLSIAFTPAAAMAQNHENNALPPRPVVPKIKKEFFNPDSCPADRLQMYKTVRDALSKGDDENPGGTDIFHVAGAGLLAYANYFAKGFASHVPGTNEAPDLEGAAMTMCSSLDWYSNIMAHTLHLPEAKPIENPKTDPMKLNKDAPISIIQEKYYIGACTAGVQSHFDDVVKEPAVAIINGSNDMLISAQTINLAIAGITARASSETENLVRKNQLGEKEALKVFCDAVSNYSRMVEKEMAEHNTRNFGQSKPDFSKMIPGVQV